jgi:hypothetical protein
MALQIEVKDDKLNTGLLSILKTGINMCCSGSAEVF